MPWRTRSNPLKPPVEFLYSLCEKQRSEVSQPAEPHVVSNPGTRTAALYGRTNAQGKIMNKNGLLSIGIAIFAGAGLAPSAAHAWSITVTGTIVNDVSQADTRHGDGMGIFDLSDPSSLVGLSYSETITTNPLLNGSVNCATADCLGRTGGSGSGVPAAPYTVSVTVNGVTFTETDSAPDTNSSFLSDALSTNNTSETPGQDQLDQEAFTNCAVVGRNCTSAFIDVSSMTPFVPTLNFNQSITAGPFPAQSSEAFFDYQTLDSTNRTQFWGTIDTLSVNSQPVGVPEPGSFLLMGLGVAATLGVMRLKTRAVIKAD
jgi:hypothetical protein